MDNFWLISCLVKLIMHINVYNWCVGPFRVTKTYFSYAHYAHSYREHTNSWSLHLRQILYVSNAAFASVNSSIHVDKTSNTILWFLNYNYFWIVILCYCRILFYVFKIVSHDFWTVISDVLLEGAIVVFSLDLSVTCSICLDSENKKN